MKIGFALTLALVATAAEGYGNYASSGRQYNSYSSYPASVSMPWGGRYGGTGYNTAPNLASAYYNPYASTNNAYQTNTYNPYQTNPYNPYQTSTYNSRYQTSPYVGNGYSTYQAGATYPTTSFVGSPLANQYLAATTAAQPAGNVCPTSVSPLIIVSDYIKYGVPQTYPCIGSCMFEPNVVLDDPSTLNYDKSEVVVLMIGPYSYPHTAFQILNNATLLNAITAQTNLFLSTIPVRPTVTDAAVLERTAAANALVKSAAASTSGVSLIDYQAFYNAYVRYNEAQWTGTQMCNWLREQIPTPVAGAAVTAATPIAGTLAPF